MTQREIRLAFFGVLAAMALAGFDSTAVATALPSIVGEFHGFDRASWIITSYLLASTITIPLYGKLSDLYGRRRLILVAIVVFVIGSVLCAVSQSMEELVVARGIQGIGAGGLIPLAIATIGDLFSPRERGKIQGYTAGLFAVTSVAGPLLGGILTDQASWRWIFLINVPIGALALGVVFVVMKIPHVRRPPRLDIAGSAVMMVAATCVLLALVWGGSEYPWGSTEVLSLLAVGTLGAVLFVAVERRASEPIYPIGLFRVKVFTVAIVSGPIIGASMFVITVYVPIYAQQVRGVTATGSGFLLIPYMIGAVLSGLVVGRLVTRTGRYKFFPIAGSVVSMTGFWLLSQLGPHTSELGTIVVMVIVGIGMGPMFQTYTLAMQNAVPRSELGSSTAALQFSRSLGGALGLAAFAAVLTNRLGSELAQRVPPGSVSARRMLEPHAVVRPAEVVSGARAALAAALDHTYLLCVPAMAVVFVCALLLPELPLRTVAPHAAGTEQPIDLMEAE